MRKARLLVLLAATSVKMYMSRDACCMEDEDQGSSQGDCVSKILVCKYHTIISLQLMYVLLRM